ncbi:MAG: hypothetical protein FD160_985 [Caulobacteraceae bacterium]|nr:MAG: hypothetical protein FD160_985 [Caulobacteraceae bacterium]
MGRPVSALRYAALEGEQSAGLSALHALGEGSDADFEAVCAEIVRMTSDEGPGPQRGGAKRARDGSRTAAKLEDRMRRRAERLALDAVRHKELIDNRELRQARSLSRRWFVLGRALEAAMADDEKFAAALRAALSPHITRPDERALLGWSQTGDVPGS